MSSVEVSPKGLVVITGASSGIGAACAQLFSEKGHPLLLLARRVDRMESQRLPCCVCAGADVTDLAALTTAVSQAKTQLGVAHVDCIINNAGVMLLGKAHHLRDPDEWQKLLDVNGMGAMSGIRAVIGEFMERRAGTVVSVSSIAGKKTFGDHGVYCATKFGIHPLTKTFRAEYAKYNIKFVVIAPGVAETELLSHTTDSRIVDEYRQRKSTIEPLQAVDVAAAMLPSRNHACANLAGALKRRRHCIVLCFTSDTAPSANQKLLQQHGNEHKDQKNAPDRKGPGVLCPRGARWKGRTVGRFLRCTTFRLLPC